ncbi:MAG TPA: sigma-54 dependent transcriptional regulator [Spirochaetota bacterium]|nr:sigma-54 dependent transcriptional regulator [Spirochaetota bacterium]
MSKILILDDEAEFCDKMAQMLRLRNYSVTAVYDTVAARKALEAESFDIILLDVFLQDGSGVEMLGYIRKRWPETAIIMMTGMEDVRTAIECIRLGAEEYFLKPVHNDELVFAIEKSLKTRRQQSELTMYRDSGNLPIIGESQSIRDVRALIERAAANPDVTVLVTGETGTGKELVARHVHMHGRRSQEAFIPINCSSIPESLIESEFFGHEKGAFTGAERQQKGVFERANGGTVFLDEIGDMEVRLQTSLLRFLETRRVHRVGGGEVDVDVRIVCATNKDLQAEVDQHRFRKDLYFRINVLNIHLPPLRERVEDIVLLTRHFIGKQAHSHREYRITEAGKKRLERYPWPGNIRELKNVVERETILAKGADLDFVQLEHGLMDMPEKCRTLDDGGLHLVIGYESPISLDAIEKRVIEGALEHCNGNVSRAAEVLQLGRSSLRSKMKRLGIGQ